MSENSTYSVITNGETLSGFEKEKALLDFAVLFKISPEKSKSFLQKERAVKKEINLKSAEIYKKKLESIGLAVILKEHSVIQEVNEGLSLSLVPTDEELNAKSEYSAETSDEIIPVKNSNTVICPKCQHEQLKESEQCTGCGVYLHKVLNQQNDIVKPVPIIANVETLNNYSDSEELTNKSIAYGVGAAFVGALVWNLIANITGYEWGLVAWAIGGLVGFTVAFTGSAGEKAGIVCGVLALVAILGGKFMIYSAMKDEVLETLAESKVEIQEVYEQELIAAKAYEEVIGESALRKFMISYNYTEAHEVSEVSNVEVEEFKAGDEERLQNFAYQAPSYDEWYQLTVNDQIDDISTFSIIKESLGLTDLAFILFGVFTAFRLGSAGYSIKDVIYTK